MASTPITKRDDVCTLAKLHKLRARRDGLPSNAYEEMRRRVLSEVSQ